MKLVYLATMLLVVPALGFADSFAIAFTGRDPALNDRWAKFCGVEGHDPEMF